MNWIDSGFMTHTYKILPVAISLLGATSSFLLYLFGSKLLVQLKMSVSGKNCKNAVLHLLPGTVLEFHGDIAGRIVFCFDFLCHSCAEVPESLRTSSFLNDTFLDGNLDELMGASIYIFLLYALIVAPWHALLFDVSEESSSSESGNGNESDNDGANDGGNVPPRPGAVAVSLALSTMANEADLPNSVAVAESWTRYEKA